MNLWRHQGLKRYITNGSWMAAEQGLRMISGVLVGIWVARYLGPGEFGLLSYALAFSALFTVFAKLGLDGVMLRDLSMKPSQAIIYLGTAFWLKIIGAFLTLGILLVSLLILSETLKVKIYIFIISSGVLFQSFEVIDFYFQSRVMSKYLAICRMFQLFVSSLAKIYLILVQADLIWFVWVSMFDQLLLATSLFVMYSHQKMSNFLSHFKLSIAKNLLKDSWPYVLSGLVVVGHMRIDQLMIQEMLGNRQVGIYSAAVRLCEVWYFLPVLITNLVLPSIINAKNISEDFYNKRIQMLYSILVWFAICIALLMTFLSDWLIKLLYGQAYEEASLVLSINIWASVFVFFGSAWSKWMLIESRNKMSAFFQINALLWNIGLNTLLIPKYGIYGAALSTLISASIGHAVLPIFIKSQRIALKMLIKSFWPVQFFLR